MNADQIYSRTDRYSDGLFIEAIIWRLPTKTPERPHRLKYRLHCGIANVCVVRYDNETGKGDHRHYGEKEEPYQFTTVSKLLADFYSDVARLAGRR